MELGLVLWAMAMVLGLILGAMVMVLGQGHAHALAFRSDILPGHKNEFAYYYRVTHHPCTLLSAHHAHKWLNNDPTRTTHNWVVVLVKDILGGGRKVACCTPSSPCPCPALPAKSYGNRFFVPICINLNTKNTGGLNVLKYSLSK